MMTITAKNRRVPIRTFCANNKTRDDDNYFAAATARKNRHPSFSRFLLLHQLNCNNALSRA